MENRRSRKTVKEGLLAALPVCLGYAPLGFACGMLSAKAGLLASQAALLSVFLYAGGAQFMIANLYIAGVSPFAAAASIALLNARHLLYGTALSKHLTGAPKGRLFVFGLEITDETFGVNFSRFLGKDWSLSHAQVVNTVSHACWILCTVAGYHAGNLIALPLPVIAFSMTSMFICLLFMQKHGKATLRAALFAALGVVVCKLFGLSKAAVLVGSLLGIVAGSIGANGAEACDEVA